MSDTSFELNIKGLDAMIKALKEKPPTLRIGILGTEARPAKKGQKDTPTNALVGAVHEFGSPARGIPQRSFLRVPLSENLEKELDNSGLLDEKTLKEVIQVKTLTPWLKQVAIVAEGVVDDAFETSGDGKWASWKSPTYTNFGGMLLVDTGSLRDSISTEVIE